MGGWHGDGVERVFATATSPCEIDFATAIKEGKKGGRKAILICRSDVIEESSSCRQKRQSCFYS